MRGEMFGAAWLSEAEQKVTSARRLQVFDETQGGGSVDGVQGRAWLGFRACPLKSWTLTCPAHAV
jgi:hypothetical protein